MSLVLSGQAINTEKHDLSKDAKSNLTKLAAWINERDIPFRLTSIGMIVMLLWAGSYKMTAAHKDSERGWPLVPAWLFDFLPRVSRTGAGRSSIFQSLPIPISEINCSAVFRFFKMTGRPSTQRSETRSNIQNSLRVLRLRPIFMLALPFPSLEKILALFP